MNDLTMPSPESDDEEDARVIRVIITAFNNPNGIRFLEEQRDFSTNPERIQRAIDFLSIIRNEKTSNS